jgi:RNA-directed DNA polymerase
MPYLANLQAAKTVNDVAALLGFRVSALTYVLYSKSAPPKFRTFQIAKRSGGTRTIEAPNPQLKRIQRRLADLLQECDAEIKQKYGRHDEGPRPDRVTHGFVRRRSIVTNAYQHRRRRLVFNLDLDNFFPSINFGRVRGFFLRDNNFLLQSAVATILAQIACSGNHLPQGSPCSPVIANLIGHILDVHLVRLAGRSGCRYTRYADDLTFSTNKREFPPNIAVQVPGTEHHWRTGAELFHLVRKSGFHVNAGKTRMQYRTSRQEVTGLVVNRKVNIPSDYRHVVRAMVHRLFVTDSFDIEKTVATASGVTTTRTVGTPAMLHGMLGFIDSIDLYNRKLHPNIESTALSSKEQAYRRFLLFKDFYAATRPVLVCEGKTDTVYLTHAIRSLAAYFPRLATVAAAGKVTLNIRRYRYAGRSTGRILGLNGGHGDLQRLLQAYREALPRFKAPGLTNAVIVLIDNDSAATAMLSTIKQLTGVAPNRALPFIHVFANLYVVLTPLPAGAATSMIEDFFDAATRSIKIGGRSFALSNGYSTASHYGKADSPIMLFSQMLQR